LQRKSREEMKLRLLQDIRTDMAVCKVEGWNPLEYIDELIELLKGLKHADSGASTKAVPCRSTGRACVDG